MSHKLREFLKHSASFALAAAGGSLLNVNHSFGAYAEPRASSLVDYDAIGLEEG